jgi:uncharacterized membrane protein YdjX (TVP38/TMEM64 family)
LKKINPIYLLIAFNVILFLLRDVFFPDYSGEKLIAGMEGFLSQFGVFGYLAVVLIYALCSFFFIPLLIPLNIACGAVYGPYVGTLVSIAGIVIGTVASTISARHVFKGMARMVETRPAAQRALAQIDRHGTIAVLLIRLAFVIPYLFQNIVLAMTSIGAYRLAMLTAVGSLPGAAIYSFLGAGLVQAQDATELALYLGIPLLLLVGVSLAVKRLNDKFG